MFAHTTIFFDCYSTFFLVLLALLIYILWRDGRNNGPRY